MPSRRSRPTVAAQPTPPQHRPPRRHRRRRRNSSQPSSASTSSSTTVSSSSEQPAAQAPRRLGLLELPDDVLHLIFLFVIDSPDASATLCYKSLHNWEYAIWIGRAHPRLYRVLKRIINTVCIYSSDTATPDEIAFTLPSLRHLTLDSHSLAPQFLHTFGSLSSSTALQSLHLENVDVPFQPFIHLVNSTRHLSALTLSFITLRDIPRALAATLKSLSSLRTLRLHGLSGLNGSCLASLCNASSHVLDKLSLRYLRHETITDVVFTKQLAPVCLSLTAIDLEHLIHVSAQALHSFFRQYAPRLSQIRIADLPFSQRQIHDVLLCAESLFDLAIANVSITDPEALALVINSVITNSCLQRLDLRGIYSMTDVDVATILNSSSCNQFPAFTLRNSPLVGDDTCSIIAGCAGESLRVLDLRGCIIFDAGLVALANQCHGLTDISFGSDGTQVPWHDAPLYRSDELSNYGFDELLMACGQTLRHFFWETPRVVVPGDGPIRFESLGIKNLHAGRLAQGLTRNCAKLIRVEVNWLRPPPSHVAERALCDLRFFELDNEHRHVSVFLDREPL